MAQGRHKRFRNSIRRLVSAEREVFEIIDTIGWDYSEVFEEGYRSLLNRYSRSRTDGETPIGMFRIAHFDLILEDLDQKIKQFQETRTIIHTAYQVQLTSTTVPEGKRELSNIFRDLADKALVVEDVTGYFNAAKARVSSGRSLDPVVKSVLKDIRTANGEHAAITEIEDCSDRAFRENLVWDWLKSRAGEVGG